MATYFGEILEVSSRAVDDDEIGEESPCKLEFITVPDLKGKKYNFSIFAFGRVAVSFVHSYFLSKNAKVIATAKITQPTSGDMLYGLNYSKKPTEVARMFVDPEDETTMICEIYDNLPGHLSTTLCEEIMQFCDDSSEAVILVNLPACTYDRSDDNIEKETFLRCLVSKIQANKPVKLGCSLLGVPNTITNFPAAVLTYFEVFKKAAVLYVCYSETCDSDAEVMSIFKHLFNLPVWRNIKKVSDAELRLSQAIKNNYKYASNLYT